MRIIRDIKKTWSVVIMVHAMIVNSFGQQPVYLDSKQPISNRVEDLISRMTLEEKIGQMNMPCVYEDRLGNDIQSKFDGCRKFAAGAKERE